MYLQLIKAIALYDIKMPAIAEIFVQEIRKLIDFEMLKPEAIIKIFKPEFSLAEFVSHIQEDLFGSGAEAIKSSSLESSGVKCGNIAVNLSMIIFAVIVAILVIVLMFCMKAICKRWKEKIVNKLKDMKKKFMWNGLIRSMSISYINICIAVLV